MDAKSSAGRRTSRRASTASVSPDATPREVGSSEHLFLGAKEVAKARSLFDFYCAQTATEDADRTMQMPTHDGLNARGVQMCMADLGILLSPNDAKDLIFTLIQSQVITSKNAEVDRLMTLTRQRPVPVSPPEPTGGPSSSVPTPPPPPNKNVDAAVTVGSISSKKSVVVSSDDLKLPFHLFLELLCSTQADCDEKVEIQQLFKALDTDSDGAISLSDIRNAAGVLRGNTRHEDVHAIFSMTTAELQCIVTECDLDGDGRVTFTDLQRVLNTS
jgi:Ca2+-binding EF-hand superfamily protein